MPRLIDADKLFHTVQEQEMWNVSDFVYESIQNAPTVEAIPIAWLKRVNSLCGQETRLQEALDLWESKGEK